MSRPPQQELHVITTPDGKAAKLRASCDACNESKVRCSQSKPVCARCEKHDIVCIYGLSRRTHRTAPRIGALAGTTRPRTNSSSNSNSSSSLQHEGNNQETTPTHSSGGTGADSPGTVHTAQTLGGNGGGGSSSVVDNLLLGSLDMLPDFDMHSYESANDYTISPALHLSMDPMQSQIPTSPNDLFSDNRTALSSSTSFDSSTNLYTLMNSHLASEAASSSSEGGGGGGACNCSTRVIRKLLSIPLSLHDGRASFDVQLSELKHAIKCCEDCIQCECASRDEMTIMILSILVGRIVQGFETSLPKSSDSSSAQSSSASQNMVLPDNSCSAGKPGGGAAPRLSWGVLEIENEDEDDLKQHLWLLHFRKLEGLLKQLGTFIRLMRSMQANDNSAHVMACGFILMWLEQKAQVVRDVLVHRKGLQLGHGDKGI